jgi:transposase-like protein
MVTPGRERLSGEVEIDDAYLGGPERGLRGRRIQRKAAIIVATEIRGKGIGRIRMQRVSDLGIQSVGHFLEQFVEPGSTIITDGWHAYARIAGYTHHPIAGFDRHDPTTDLLPRAHRVISLLKRWLLGTHQGAVSHAHLDYYLDEFVFRFNRRTSQHRGKLFYRLLQNAVQTPPVPYCKIVKNRPPTKTKGPQPIVAT